jgi:hypothetical protein
MQKVYVKGICQLRITSSIMVVVLGKAIKMCSTPLKGTLYGDF